MHVQILQILAGVEGLLDDVAVTDVRRFLGDLALHLETNAVASELAQKLTFKGNDLKDRSLAVIKAFRATWK
jgi:hypothetical protein